MSKYILIIILSLFITLCSGQNTVVFTKSNLYEADFGIYQWDLLGENSYPAFFSKSQNQLSFSIQSPTFFYTTTTNPFTVLARPNDTFLIKTIKNRIIIQNRKSDESSIILRLIDSLGQFSGTDAVDHVMPVLKSLPKGLTIKIKLKNNIERDSLLYYHYQRRIKFIDSQKGISNFFRENWLLYFKYDYLSKSIGGLIIEPKELSSISNFWKTLDIKNLFNDSTLLNIDRYRTFIIQYINYLSYKKNGPQNSILQRILTVDTMKMDKNVKNWILFSLARKAIQTKKYDFTFENILKKNQLNEVYEDRLANLLNIYKMSDDFKKQTQLLSHNNSLVNFNNLLLSKKDSLVVVDFWATWCVPCLNQMAKLKLLRDRLHNEKVAFIFVSVDEDINSWYSFHKKGLLNQENSYLLLNNFNSQLAKKFSLRTIPRTMVFKKGEVQFAEISINDLPKIVNRQYE